jgi:hypothetical protein
MWICWFSAQLPTGQWEEIYFFKWNLNISNLQFEGNFRLVLNGDIGFSLVNKVHFLVMLKVEGKSKMETSSNPSRIPISIIYIHYRPLIMSIKTLKNGPQKLLIIGPNPFISQSSPDHRPQPRIDFSCYEISGPDICSLICDWTCGRFWNPVANSSHL